MKLDNLNILLIEDDEVDIMNVKRSFKKNELNNPLFVARNGMEALDMLRGENGHRKIFPIPRIILLDINMPKMNGLEFLKELRKDPNLKSISVYMMSTSRNVQDKIAAYGLNVSGYIQKSLLSQDSIDTVARLGAFWRLCEFV